MNYLATCPDASATIEAIDLHFKRNMRGVVNKLVEVKRVLCLPVPA